MEPLSGILMIVAVLAIVIVVVLIVRWSRQMTRTSAAMEQLVHRLNEQTVPRLNRVLEGLEGELEEVRSATRSAHQIVDRIHATIDRAEETVQPALETATEVTSLFHQLTAVIKGVKAGVSSFLDSTAWRPETRSRERTAAGSVEPVTGFDDGDSSRDES